MVKRVSMAFPIFILLVIFTTMSTSFSSLQAAGVWYVSPVGNDANNCSDPATPCATINGALAKPSFAAGDTVRVEIGRYTGTGSEVVLINKGVILSGGWDAGFSAQAGWSTIDGEGVRIVIYLRWDTAGAVSIDHFIIQGGYTSGIEDFSPGVLTVAYTQLSNNTAGQTGQSGAPGGAGIHVSSGTLILNNSAVTNNHIRGSFRAGGIDSSGTVVINNSTISNNDTEGIFSMGNGVSINSSTIVDNGSYGLYTYGTTNATIQNTILTGNALNSANHLDCMNEYGTFSSQGYNLIGIPGSCSFSGTDQTGVDPGLLPLRGTPPVRPFLPGQLPHNAGNPAGCLDNAGNLLLIDQRGMSRVARCDIGAFESTVSTGTGTSLFKQSGDGQITGRSKAFPLPLQVAVMDDQANLVSGAGVTFTAPATGAGLVFSDSGTSTTSVTSDQSGMATSPRMIANDVVGTYRVNALTGSTSTVGFTLTNGYQVFLPTISHLIDPGLYGTIRYKGSPAAGVPLELRWYNGATWSTIRTAVTQLNGAFAFLNVPALSSNQRYYVRYQNGTDPTRLSSWSTRVLTSYSTTQVVSMGEFDVEDVQLYYPGSSTYKFYLPMQFMWYQRTATTSDRYEFNLFDPNSTLAWWGAPVSYLSGSSIASFTLNSLPTGFAPQAVYGWYMGVYSPDGGYGTSFYYRRISFANTGSSAAQSPSATLNTKGERIRPSTPSVEIR